MVLCAASCGSSEGTTLPPARLHFTDVTASTGIDFVTTFGQEPATQILEVKGGGLALLDYDGDGDLDIFVPNGATMAKPEEGPGCRLFENQGGLRFRDSTKAAKLQLTRWGAGVTAADYDGDGHVDLYVACFGSNALLRNLGNGSFEDVTEQAGVAGQSWSIAAAFGDLDGDGDLDLFVTNYIDFDIAHPPAPSSFKGAPVFTGPMGLIPAADDVYENIGHGRFRKRGPETGLEAQPPAFGLGTLILDFDRDGHQDIFVGNDSMGNQLFLGRGDWTFKEVAKTNGLGVNVYGSAQSTMGIAIGDVNGNGFPDVFTSNFSNDTNTLHINREGRFYDDVTARFGLGMVAFPYVGWASGFYDFDLDGDEDLMVFNGHVYPNATCEVMDAEFKEPALLYRKGQERFSLVNAMEGGDWLESLHCDRGAAFGDLDGDGDVDVVVLELNGPLRVLRNDALQRNWLAVELEGAALGSRVRVSDGAQTQSRWIASGGSFASSSETAAHFGFEAPCESVRVEVLWPNGKTSVFPKVPTNQRLRASSD